MASDISEGEQQIELIQEEFYQPIMRDAMLRLPFFDDSSELAKYLFRKDELLWLKDNLRTSP